MDNLISQLSQTLYLLRINSITALYIVGILWAIYFINALLFHKRLNILGIYPRDFWGLFGIFFHSFLHGDFSHLFFNSIPFFALTDFMLIDGLSNYIKITISISLLSGLAIWLFGRKGIHIGVSSLISGYFGFLLANAYKHPSISSIFLAIICAYYFGGIFLGIFPQEEKVSWEGHLFGFLAGLAVALVSILQII